MRLFLDPPQPPAPNPADYVKDCETCGGKGTYGVHEVRRSYLGDDVPIPYLCDACEGLGIILLPLPAWFRPRCWGCGKFLKRARNQWGEWRTSCWDCAPDDDFF